MLYLTADDAGASVEASERIEMATQNRYVNSVSIPTKAEGFDDAVRRFT